MRIKPSIFLFRHKTSGHYYYGHGVTSLEAKQGLIEILNYKPNSRSLKHKLDKHKQLSESNIIIHGRPNNYYPFQWAIKKVLGDINYLDFRSFIDEVTRELPENSKLINIYKLK